MSYRGPKVKLSRKLGIALTDKAAVVMNKRPNPPGQHGAKRRKAQSEFGKQLLEKQRLKFQYNISERQLRKYCDDAIKSKGNSSELLINTLESRLDAMIYRSGYCPTIFAARQFVVHGHVMVNGKKVDIPSFLVKTTDIVAVKEKSQQLPMVQVAVHKTIVPPYIEQDKSAYTCKFMRSPERQEVPIICELQRVVEFYSR